MLPSERPSSSTLLVDQALCTWSSECEAYELCAEQELGLPGTYRRIVPSDRFLKTMNAVHRALLAVSFGRLGWRAGTMPVLELTTTGRRTGRRHAVLLTSPVQQGSTLVVVASRGGDDHSPEWYLNLLANPEVEVALQGRPAVAMLARVADSDERIELWPQVTAEFGNYASYQRRTDREIPLVLLEPAAR
jgi:deazaflavin-dependent oxidoreductase (nitroreductase family)